MNLGCPQRMILVVFLLQRSTSWRVAGRHGAAKKMLCPNEVQARYSQTTVMIDATKSAAIE
jgi:hypothetical protein